jgi:hypothetical protein
MEIKIGKSARACTACAAEFVHDQEFTSLVRIENQALVREDYCKACWHADRGAGAFSVWSPRFYDSRVADQQPPEVFSPLRQLFYEAVESEDRDEMAKAYLAAQLLRRQKAFRLVKEADDAERDLRVVLFADRIGNRLIEVRDPSLTFAELERGRAALLERLNALENPTAAEASADDAGSEES